MKQYLLSLFDLALVTALAAASVWVGCSLLLGWPSELCKWAAIAAAFVASSGLIRFGRGGRFQTLRGRELISPKRARLRAGARRPDEDPGLLWGGIYIPSRLGTNHFLVAGSPGSGKTLTLKMLMGSALQLVGTGKGHRALVYDDKKDMVGILKGILPGDKAPRIVLLNPFDARGAAWDMAADITSPETAEHLAHVLVPEERSASQPFFADAVRHLLGGVFISFMRTRPGQWTFRDVLCTMRSVKRLRTTLLACPETCHLVERYFSRADTFQDIFATIATKLQRYETAAAAWTRASEAISLNAWLNGDEEYILVIGNDDQARSVVEAINRVLFKRIVELVLSQPDVKQGEARRTWFFLDELRMAGCLDGLNALLTKGRSKGACVAIGFQDLEGLEVAYGREVAHEMLGQCATKAFLRIESVKTAEWASKVIGQAETLIRTTSDTRSGGLFGHVSRATGEHIQHRNAVEPTEITKLPMASLEEGFEGFYVVPDIGAYKFGYTGKDLKRLLTKDDESLKDYPRRPADDLYLTCDDGGRAPGGPDGPAQKGSAEDPSSAPSDEPSGEGAEDWSPLSGVSRARRSQR